MLSRKMVESRLCWNGMMCIQVPALQLNTFVIDQTLHVILRHAKVGDSRVVDSF